MKFERKGNWYYVNGYRISKALLDTIFSEMLTHTGWNDLLKALQSEGSANLNFSYTGVVSNDSADNIDRRKIQILEKHLTGLYLKMLYSQLD